MTSLYYVNDGVPEITTELLRAACLARDVTFVEIVPSGFTFEPDSRLPPGSLLYRPAISIAALRVEQFLYGDGVATFYREPHFVFTGFSNYPLLFERADLPVPRSLPLVSTDRDLLRTQVRAVGGFPVVMKMPGGSAGIGTIQVDTFAGLFSLTDFLLARGENPMLCAFVDHAVHWRVIVIGSNAVAAYRNITEPDDFRTYASEHPLDFTTDPPERMARIAVGAAELLGIEFAGVDILEHPSGRLYLLEANFPCYFAQAQVFGKIDIAGMMIDYLMHKKDP
jgi:hypothetical protein